MCLRRKNYALKCRKYFFKVPIIKPIFHQKSSVSQTVSEILLQWKAGVLFKLRVVNLYWNS
jgi:hypothetical protein